MIFKCYRRIKYVVCVKREGEKIKENMVKCKYLMSVGKGFIGKFGIIM